MFLKNAELGNNQWYLYIATGILVVVGTVLGQLPMIGILLMKGASDGMSESEMAAVMESMDFSGIDLDNNLLVSLMLLAFIVGLVFLWLGVKYIHAKPFRAMITPKPTINWRKIFFSFGFWMLLTIVVELIFYFIQPEIYSFQFDLTNFLILVLIAFILFPFQTSFEELFFRGYLMQGISLISKYRWFPLIVTSVSFGALHFANPEVQAFGLGLSMTYYIGVGLFLGIITLMDDSLELALGIHAATNIYGALFVTFDESAIQTAALFHTTEINMGWMLVGFFAAAIIFIIVASKKYGWNDWSKCYGEVERPQIEDPTVSEIVSD